jgi:hypothetical protein
MNLFQKFLKSNNIVSFSIELIFMRKDFAKGILKE